MVIFSYQVIASLKSQIQVTVTFCIFQATLTCHILQVIFPVIFSFLRLILVLQVLQLWNG